MEHQPPSHDSPHEHNPDSEQVIDRLMSLRDREFTVRRNANQETGQSEYYEAGWIIEDVQQLADGRIGVRITQPEQNMYKRILATELLSWQPESSEELQEDTVISPFELERHDSSERVEEALGDVALEASGLESFEAQEDDKEDERESLLKAKLDAFFETSDLNGVAEQGEAIQMRSRRIVDLLEDTQQVINATLYDTSRKESTARHLADTLGDLRSLVGQGVVDSEELNGSLRRMAGSVEDMYQARVQADQDSQERLKAKLIDETYDELAQYGRIVDISLAEVAEFLKGHGKFEREIDSLAHDRYGYETTLSMLRNYVQSMIDSMHAAQGRAGMIGDRVADIEKAR